MADIKTRAITEVRYDNKKLKEFKITHGRPDNVYTDKDMCSILLRRANTYVNFEENKFKFSKYIELTKNTKIDFLYLCQCMIKEFPNHDFNIVPILELYEALLRENWEEIKLDRETLDSIQAYTRTPLANVHISESIVQFLKDCVYKKTSGFENNN